MLSGGLNPENVRDAIRTTGATTIDVSSGFEERPGKKDHARMRTYLAAVNPGTRLF